VPGLSLAQAQHAGAGVDAQLAVRPGGRQIQVQIGVQLALPGKILGEEAGETIQREITQPVTQLRFRQQPLLLGAERCRGVQPAVCAQLHAAIGAPADRRRALQGPALFMGLERRAQQAALPVGILQAAVERGGEIQRRPIEP